MKLYNSMGPNPKMVRMFLAERDVSVEIIDLDLMAGENRQDAHMARNPSGQSPTLELDNGNFIAEITAICEYVEDINGASDLIGTTAEARAETRMWLRRIDLQIVEPLTNGFRFSEGLAIFKDRLRCFPEVASDLKLLAQERLTWLDGQMAGKTFVCGERFSLADIHLYAFLEFGTQVGQPLNEDNKNIAAWYERVGQRASAAA